MASASASLELPVPPEEVWRLIGGFGTLHDWHPVISGSEVSEGGRVRRLTTSGGDVIVERLEAFDEAGRSYSYSFIESPFPVSKYRATLRVREADDGRGSRVDWSGEFLPDGVTDEEAVELFQGIYNGGLKAIADIFTPKGS
ncbi:SRPBCC family protein [Paludisphaera mucosa]|uniref:SRPBCC family protein n=1 Tax=Paludisphaera mucosa TaxID=3030827 RepID=A0ABT6F4U9_9BACT|nr:SRPBCC family protein [Paludisphaera mucosa]